jgi:hypothetical protein
MKKDDKSEKPPPFLTPFFTSSPKVAAADLKYGDDWQRELDDVRREKGERTK